MRALILVDLQNDFMPDGALGVPEGDRVVTVANQMQRLFGFVVATQDWHPVDHGSFARNHPGRGIGELIDLDGIAQVLWPVHCVQNSPGSELVSTLDTIGIRRVFQKGTDPKIDSYSAFFDNGHRQSTGLADYLRENGIRHVYLLGLATDYCVKFSALDAIQLGFETTVIEDGCRGVELKEGDQEKAIEEMRSVGVCISTSSDIMQD